MTVYEMFEDALVKNGLSQVDAHMIMELVAMDGDNKYMLMFWNNDKDDFPPEMFGSLWLSVKKHAAPKVLEISLQGK
jgi:hypothetical protein